MTRWVSKYDYPAILAQMIDHCGGVGNEVQMSSRRMADEISTGKAVVADLRKVAERVGGLTSRYEGGPKKHGRISFWTFTQNAQWIEDQAMAQFGVAMNAYSIEHKLPKDYRYNQSTRKKPHSPDDPPPMPGSPDPRPTEEGEVGSVVSRYRETAISDGEIVIAAEETDLAVKLKAAGITRKKSDAEALIEAARQYMGREEFIAEELKRFADMGITIDETAIHVEKDERLEGVVPLIGYIDDLAGIIDRQADRLEKVQQTGASADTIAQLKRDVFDANEETRRVRHAYDEYKSSQRQKLNHKDQEIQRLRTEVEELAVKNLQLVGKG